MDPELEAYRKQAIETLKQNAGFIRNTANDVLGVPCREVYIVGSVLDRNAFHEGSDIDVAVVVDGDKLETGLNEKMSEKLQNEMQRWPMGDVGVVNTLVFINKLDLVRGKAMKVAVDVV
jgi:predicted nucleotidyltransferase